MALENYLNSSNLLWIIGAIAIGLIGWYLIKNSGSWSRPREEKIELEEEKDLERVARQEIKLEKSEKKIIKQLIKNFNVFLQNYVLIWNSSESTIPRRTEKGQASLSPEEMANALQTIILKLKKIEKEDIPLKTEESFFSKLVEYWGFVYNEIGKWGFVPNQRKSSDYEKGLIGVRGSQQKINDLMNQLGADLKLEEQFDEMKKREILNLYQETLREEGVQS